MFISLCNSSIFFLLPQFSFFYIRPTCYTFLTLPFQLFQFHFHFSSLLSLPFVVEVTQLIQSFSLILTIEKDAPQPPSRPLYSYDSHIHNALYPSIHNDFPLAPIPRQLFTPLIPLFQTRSPTSFHISLWFHPLCIFFGESSLINPLHMSKLIQKILAHTFSHTHPILASFSHVPIPNLIYIIHSKTLS